MKYKDYDEFLDDIYHREFLPKLNEAIQSLNNYTLGEITSFYTAIRRDSGKDDMVSCNYGDLKCNKLGFSIARKIELCNRILVAAKSISSEIYNIIINETAVNVNNAFILNSFKYKSLFNKYKIVVDEYIDSLFSNIRNTVKTSHRIIDTINSVFINLNILEVNANAVVDSAIKELKLCFSDPKLRSEYSYRYIYGITNFSMSSDFHLGTLIGRNPFSIVRMINDPSYNNHNNKNYDKYPGMQLFYIAATVALADSVNTNLNLKDSVEHLVDRTSDVILFKAYNNVYSGYRTHNRIGTIYNSVYILIVSGNYDKLLQSMCKKIELMTLEDATNKIKKIFMSL